MVNLVINKNVELKNSFEWIKKSFYVFRESPVHFIVLGIFNLLIGLLPLLGSFMSPLLIARFASLVMMVENGEKIKFSHVFEDIFVNKTVVKLAFLNFCLNGIILMGQIFYENKTGHSLISLQTNILLIIGLLTPLFVLQIAMWLSPIICLNYSDIKPINAMWMSLQASMYNVPTFIFYTLLLVVFTLLALLPLFLGLLIWLPILNISCYFICKSVILQIHHTV